MCNKQTAVEIKKPTDLVNNSNHYKLPEDLTNMKLIERASFELGEKATLQHTFSEEDLFAYAKLSGDNNPIHTDSLYASTTFFKGQIVHGMLVAGLISSVLGNQLPGPGAIYLEQELRFVAPVRIGDNLSVEVEVTGWDQAKGRVTLRTEVSKEGGNRVLTGHARLVMSSFLGLLK